MKVASQLRDPRTVARWHNIWLSAALLFFVTAATFSGLFGWAYTQWQNEEGCHDYHASLVHLPPTVDIPTTFRHLNGELHLRKGATYEASSCEGKLAQSLILRGNVLDDEQEDEGRRLSPTTAPNSGPVYLHTIGTCKCNTTTPSKIFSEWRQNVSYVLPGIHCIGGTKQACTPGTCPLLCNDNKRVLWCGIGETDTFWEHVHGNGTIHKCSSH